MHQAGAYVSAISYLDFLEVTVPGFKLVQLPFGSIGMQMRHALAGQRGSSRRQKEFQTLHHDLSRLCYAAGIEPQDAEGQCRVNRKLGFMRIHSQNGEAGLSAMQNPTGINGTKRPLEIDRCGQPRGNVSGKAALQGALQTALVGQARGTFRGGGAAVSLPADFQFARTGLPQPLHRQPQHLMFDFDVKHSPHQISLRGPKMQQTLVVFAGNGVLRLRQIKHRGTIVEHDGVACSGKKIFNGASQGFGESWLECFHPAGSTVCDV
jgi:hypothetical protein